MLRMPSNSKFYRRLITIQYASCLRTMAYAMLGTNSLIFFDVVLAMLLSKRTKEVTKQKS